MQKRGIMLRFQCGLVVILSVVVLGLSEDGNRTSSCAEKERSLAILDIAAVSISKARKLYPKCNEFENVTTANASSCGKREKSLAYLEVAEKMILDARKHYPTCANITDITTPPEITTTSWITTSLDITTPTWTTTSLEITTPTEEPQDLPMDCTEVLKNGHNASGFYTIAPRNRTSPLQVFCDMDTDGGGWTVIQRRGNFSKFEDFFRGWADYKVGFGNITEEFWIGNDNIYDLSNQGECSVRFDLQDADGINRYAQYKNFSIGDEKANYTLHIDNYSGDAGDCMRKYSGKVFSTKDKKNLKYSDDCEEKRKSGWWFTSCTYCNLNGVNQAAADNKQSMYWHTFRQFQSLWRIEIKLRRN